MVPSLVKLQIKKIDLEDLLKVTGQGGEAVIALHCLHRNSSEGDKWPELANKSSTLGI